MTRRRRAHPYRKDPAFLRALGAAAACAALTACGPAPDDYDLADAAPVNDAGAAMDEPDAGEPDAGTFADAGAPVCDAQQWEEKWVECCDAAGWPMDQGCLAWGPPAPPSFPQGVA